MYQQGTASSLADLLSQFATFAVGAGWTVNSPTSGSVFSKGTVFCGVFAPNTVDLHARGCLSYNAGAAWNAQPNNSGFTHGMNLTHAGPYTQYHFYATQEDSKDLLAMIVELSAGVYRHWVLCDLVKYGSWTGGTYTDSVFWNMGGQNWTNYPESPEHRYISESLNIGGVGTGHIWIDYDGKTNNWQTVNDSGSSSTSLCNGSMRGSAMSAGQLGRGRARWNERTILLPLNKFANRASGLRSPIGRVPNMRAVNLTNHVAGELLTVGSDTWQVFPVAQRNAISNVFNSGVVSSGMYGYAYKR